MGIMESALDFTFSIKSTNEFNELIQTKTIIEKDRLLKNQLVDFNKNLSKIYMSNKNQNEIKVEVEQLTKHYRNFTQRDDVKEYLKASASFNQMMYQINQYINELMQKDVMLK